MIATKTCTLRYFNYLYLLLEPVARVVCEQVESLKEVYRAGKTESSIISLYRGNELFLLENPGEISKINIDTKQRTPFTLIGRDGSTKGIPNMVPTCVQYASIMNKDILFVVAHTSNPQNHQTIRGILIMTLIQENRLLPRFHLGLGEIPVNIKENHRGLAVFNVAGLFFTLRTSRILLQLKMVDIEDDLAHIGDVLEKGVCMPCIHLPCGILALTTGKSNGILTIFVATVDYRITKISITQNQLSNRLGGKEDDLINFTQQIPINIEEPLLVFDEEHKQLLLYGFYKPTNDYCVCTIEASFAAWSNEFIIENTTNIPLRCWQWGADGRIFAIDEKHNLLKCRYSISTENPKFQSSHGASSLAANEENCRAYSKESMSLLWHEACTSPHASQ